MYLEKFSKTSNLNLIQNKANTYRNIIFIALADMYILFGIKKATVINCRFLQVWR